MTMKTLISILLTLALLCMSIGLAETSEGQDAESMMMWIGETAVAVAWEDNDAVRTLRELVAEQPLTIEMSMYGGFEQVGSIGTALPRNDEQTATQPGDIVLYSGNQMVVFYGSNSWAYTRLGRVTDKTAEEMAELLFHGDVTITVALDRESDGETEKYTRYTNYTPRPAEPVGLIPGTDHSTLVAWFSRVGNTVFDPEVDVVSTASLQVDASGELTGNAQMIAGWIAEETGADVFPIQTAYTYPSDYDQTVEVGEGQDIDQVEIKLAAYLEDVSTYDTVWIVVPIWHYTICTPLRMFLESTDLSGKTVYVVTTHRGSGFADVPERVQEMEPGAQVIAALSVPGNDAPKHRDVVLDYVKNNMK